MSERLFCRLFWIFLSRALRLTLPFVLGSGSCFYVPWTFLFLFWNVSTFSNCFYFIFLFSSVLDIFLLFSLPPFLSPSFRFVNIAIPVHVHRCSLRIPFSERKQRLSGFFAQINKIITKKQQQQNIIKSSLKLFLSLSL